MDKNKDSLEKNKLLQFNQSRAADKTKTSEQSISNKNNIMDISKLKKIKQKEIKASNALEDSTKNKQKKDIDFVLLGIVAIIIVASISMIFTYIDQEMQIAELREQRAVILEKAKVEEKEIERLEKILSQVGTMEFIERQARERLGMIKPGETIYVDLNKMRN